LVRVTLNEPGAGAIRKFLGQRREQFLMPWSVLTETTSLLVLRADHRIMSCFLQALPGSGLILTQLEPEDLTRAAELVREYLDSGLDFVDATIVAFAERRNIRTILTIDRRCFGMIRPKHCEAFEIYP